MIICRPNDFDFCRQKSNDCQTAGFKTYWSSIIFLIPLQRQECSSFGRAKAGVDRGYNYHCHTCIDSFNSVDTILKTIHQLSGNAFLSWWQFQGRRDQNGYPGDPIQENRISIPGAKVFDLAHAVEITYILLATGFNDLIAGHSPFHILCDITMLVKAIKTKLPGSSLTAWHPPPFNFRQNWCRLTTTGRRAPTRFCRPVRRNCRTEHKDHWIQDSEHY